MGRRTPFPAAALVVRLAFGELPLIATAARARRADLLRAYSFVYLEEELRREALVRDWAAFARFLQLAAAHSGELVNYAAISRGAGVSLPTVKGMPTRGSRVGIVLRDMPLPADSQSTHCVVPSTRNDALRAPSRRTLLEESLNHECKRGIDGQRE